MGRTCDICDTEGRLLVEDICKDCWESHLEDLTTAPEATAEQFAAHRAPECEDEWQRVEIARCRDALAAFEAHS